MERVIIGVDPHKLSATIEVVDDQERLLGSGRFSTDKAGYAAMRSYVKAWPDRVWAVEGANGAGRPLAQRLVEAGERVVDVPAKLAARVRLFDRAQVQVAGLQGAEVAFDVREVLVGADHVAGVHLVGGQGGAQHVDAVQGGIGVDPYLVAGVGEEASWCIERPEQTTGRLTTRATARRGG